MMNKKSTTFFPKTNTRRGFTLIEIIVSLMIFSIVVLVALSALVKIIDANKKAQTLQDSVINLSFTLESMSREMRSGSDYYCQEGLNATIGTLTSTNIAAQCVNGLSQSNTANGVLFAFAFCPYSGVLFFGVLIPLILKSASGLLLPSIFALGTGLPVIIFSFLIAYSMKTVSKAFQSVQKVEKWLRYGVANIFILSGLYYTQYLIQFIMNL